MLAADSDDDTIVQKILNANKAAIEEGHITTSINFLEQDKDGMTALMYATRSGKMETIFLLFENRSITNITKDIMIKNKEGKNVIDMLTSYQQNDTNALNGMAYEIEIYLKSFILKEITITVKEQYGVNLEIFTSCCYLKLFYLQYLFEQAKLNFNDDRLLLLQRLMKEFQNYFHLIFLEKRSLTEFDRLPTFALQEKKDYLIKEIQRYIQSLYNVKNASGNISAIDIEGAKRARALLQDIQSLTFPGYGDNESSEFDEASFIFDFAPKVGLGVSPCHSPCKTGGTSTGYLRLSIDPNNYAKQHNQLDRDCIILPAKYYKDNNDNNIDIMIKFRKTITTTQSTVLEIVKHEYQIMYELNHKYSKKFVKPYGLIIWYPGLSNDITIITSIDVFTDNATNSSYNKGFSGQSSLYTQYIWYGIIMERGRGTLYDYLLKRQYELTRLELFVIIEKLIDIIIAAHDTNIILMDFKPKNIIFISDEDTGEVVWKAIDFDNSRHCNEEININNLPDLTSWEYGCFEIAKFIHEIEHGNGSGSGGGTPVLRVDVRMDVCALGWLIWKLICGKSFWQCLSSSNDISETTIRSHLCTLSDDDIQSMIEKYFSDDPQLISIKRWLTYALKVDPMTRLTLKQLRTTVPLVLGASGTTTANTSAASGDELVSKVVMGVAEFYRKELNPQLEAISQQIGNLHMDLQDRLLDLECNLQDAVYQGKSDILDVMDRLLTSSKQTIVVSGNSTDSNGVNILLQQLNNYTIPQAIATSLKELFQQQQEALQAQQLASNTTNTMIIEEQSKKIDELLGLVKDMKNDLIELKQINKQQLNLLSEIQLQGNRMPHLFCILPQIKKKDDVVEGGTGNGGMWNFMKRMKESMVDFVWTSCRLYFVCPVTLAMVSNEYNCFE